MLQLVVARIAVYICKLFTNTVIHKLKHEHEKEYSLHVVGAVGPLTKSCTA